ncbi:MAG: hypothetical protein U0223_14225 [Nitrospira sp.]|nr:hypothetical protein [Nitrospira sp.]
MIAQGLLVKQANGKEYLLTTEPNRGTCGHRLVVVTRVNGQWKPVEGVQEVICREALIGAFLDFVVDLCRVLNSADPQQVSEVVPVRQPSSGVRHATGPALRRRGRNCQ